MNCPVTDLNKIFSERRDFRRASKDGCHGVIGVFNLADATDATVHTVYPRGIDPSRSYAVTFNNCGATVELSGAEMMLKGIRVTLSGSLSSELIIYEVI